MIVSKIEKDELDMLPYITFKGEIHSISTKQKAVESAAWLSRQHILGFDTETKPRFSAGKMFKQALLQLATKDRT